MAGPNPYKLYSYAEALHFGRVYVICYECRRYSLVSKERHGDRDSRSTTWSCCICGESGHTTQQEPGPHIREDTRGNPQRHPKAISRLTGKLYRPSVSMRLRETPKDHRRNRG